MTSTNHQLFLHHHEEGIPNARIRYVPGEDPWATLTFQDDSGNEVTVFLTAEQAEELSAKLPTIFKQAEDSPDEYIYLPLPILPIKPLEDEEVK